jgi:hypothetical protein
MKVSRLRWVADAITGAPVNTGIERAECILDEEGHTLIWRVWRAGPDGGWHADEWRPPTSWMEKRRATQGGAA